MTDKTKELTPAQKAAQTRAANKAAREAQAAQEAQEAVQEVSEPTPEPTPAVDYKAIVEKLQEVYGLGVNASVSRTEFEDIMATFGNTEDK